jgi:hypothetical protein
LSHISWYDAADELNIEPINGHRSDFGKSEHILMKAIVNNTPKRERFFLKRIFTGKPVEDEKGKGARIPRRTVSADRNFFRQWTNTSTIRTRRSRCAF